MELSDDRDVLLVLVLTVQSFLSSGGIDWQRFDGFGHMWRDLYRLCFHGKAGWEKEDMLLSDSRKAAMCQKFEGAATIEAKLHLRDHNIVPADWSYETLSLIGWECPSLEVFMSAIHAWLVIGGKELKRELDRNQNRRFTN